ncbi:MAG: 30S ribosomal protein S16 [Patescibacteria group bacterium]
MLMIRLQRVGRKHEPVFRLVLTDSKNSTKSGKFLEILGSFDSRKDEDAKFDNEKILRHISNGAQLSDTVHNLLLKRGVIQGTKRNVLARRPKIKVEVPNTQAQPVQELVQEEAVSNVETEKEVVVE